MLKDEIFQYAKIALANKDLNTVLNDSFRDAVLQYFSNKNYSYTDIDKIQVFMTELVTNLKKTGLNRLSEKEFEDFFSFYTEHEDKSNEYIPGIYRGSLVYEDSFAVEPMYEDENMRIIHIGTLHYDDNQESIEKYRVVKFATEETPASIFECYSNINSIVLADSEEYRNAIKEQLNRLNVKRINCRGYIGTLAKNEKTQKYQVNFDKVALSAVMDYEQSVKEKGGDPR